MSGQKEYGVVAHPSPGAMLIAPTSRVFFSAIKFSAR
jgi:hypothetical protein